MIDMVVRMDHGVQAVTICNCLRGFGLLLVDDYDNARERERDKYVALYIDFIYIYIYINKLSNYLLYLILSYLSLS